jgi:hypothetical protein
MGGRERFQDSAGLPVQGAKKGKGLVYGAIGLGAIVLLAIIIKIGKSTQDPKAVVKSPSESAKIEDGESVAKQTDKAAQDVVAADGSIQSIGEQQERSIKQRAATSIQEAQRKRLADEREAYDKKMAEERRRQGLPTSVDAQGRPLADQELGQGGTGAQQKVQIPGFADQWNPETDVFVAAGDGRPAYRYIPAHLRGTNNPSKVESLVKLEDKWLDSIAKGSYGASVQTNTLYNTGLPAQLSARQKAGGAYGVTIEEFNGVRQPGQTPKACPPTAKKGTRK